MMDAIDRRLINALHGGLPICERPYAAVGERLGLAEDDVVARLRRLTASGVLSRFGPLYDAERLGGGLTLAAMAVPTARFEEVAAIVNGFPEVAHNYQRAHELNMWFVVATERPEQIAEVLSDIKAATGLSVLNLPKTEEYFPELKLSA
jgi:DNA-binding Lrp family transcriptional regulator